MRLEDILAVLQEAYNEQSWDTIEDLIMDLEAETSIDALDISSIDENE